MLIFMKKTAKHCFEARTLKMAEFLHSSEVLQARGDDLLIRIGITDYRDQKLEAKSVRLVA